MCEINPSRLACFDGQKVAVLMKGRFFLKGNKQFLRIHKVQDATVKNRRQVEYWKLLHDTALVMMRELALDQLLEALVRKAMELGSRNGYVYLQDNPDSNTMYLKVNIGSVPRAAAYSKGTDKGIVGRVWESGQSQVIHDYQQWRHRITTPDFADVRTAIGIPLALDGKIMGVFGLHYTEDHPVDHDEIAMLNGFAELASIALGNARLHSTLHEAHEELTAANEELTATEEELRAQYDQLIQVNEQVLRQNAVLSTLHETAVGLMGRLDLNDVLKMIVSSATDLLGTRHGYINLIDEAKQSFVRKIGLGHYAQDVGREIKITEGMSEQVYKNGEITAIDDYCTWENRIVDPLYDLIHCNIGIPLKAGNEVVGTLGLAFLDPNRKITDHEITLLTRFAEMASMALDNAMLLNSYKSEIEERIQAEKLQTALYLISETVSSSDNLDELYHSVHTIIDQLLPARNFLIATCDEKESVIRYSYFVDEVAENPGCRPFARGFSEYVIRSGRPLLANEKTIADLCARREIESALLLPKEWMGVPLKTAENKVFGVMIVRSYGRGPKFTKHDIDILSFVSNQVAMAIQRKRAEDKSRYLGLHDALTGLYNRAYFTEEMRRHQGERYLPNTVVMCDLDGLKLVNDTFGHAAGDQLLIATAGIIREAIREGDVTARIGGDEFAILLPASDEKIAFSLLDRLRGQIEKYNRKTTGVPLSVSLGYSVRYHRDTSIEDLLKQADNSMYREKLHHSRSARSTIVQTVMKLLEERDFVTEEHAERLQDLTAKLALRLSLSEPRTAEIRLMAKFHDVGKIGIPDHILLKAAPLTASEWAEMKRHSEIGYRIAQSSPDLVPIADWILKHHEWWNGEGYPFGLKGEEIPLECRILAIVDAYDAMTSDRPYRKAMRHEDAIEEIRRYAGVQFDPGLAESFIVMMELDLN